MYVRRYLKHAGNVQVFLEKDIPISFVCLLVYSFIYLGHVVQAGLTTPGLKGLSGPSLPSGGTPGRSHH